MAVKPRADDDDLYPTYLGIGTVNAMTGPKETPEPPGVWLPMHRSGSKYGGWRKQPIAEAPRRPIGFRRP